MKQKQKTFLEIGDFNFLKENGTYWIAFDVAENWGIYAENIQGHGKGQNKLYWTCCEIREKILNFCLENRIKNLNIELVWATDMMRNHKTTAKLSQLKGMIEGVFLSLEMPQRTFAYNENLALTFLFGKDEKRKYRFKFNTYDNFTYNINFDKRPKIRKNKKLFTNLRYLEWKNKPEYILNDEPIYSLENQDLCDAWMMWFYHWAKTKTDGQFENDT